MTQMTEQERKRKKPLRALENNEFIHSSEARILRILSEYVYPASVFRTKEVTDTVVFFGSARVYPPDDLRHHDDLSGADYGSGSALDQYSRYYVEAMKLAEGITRWSLDNQERLGRRVSLCTGGGPGIMEAANRGARLAGGDSIGLNIELPHEQSANPYISEHLNFNFHYFFMRKYWFLYYIRTLVVFPGGFGTLDELFETLTLRQTQNIKNRIPVYLYGSDFWKRLVQFDFLAEAGLISRKDLELFSFVDSVDEALAQILPVLEEQLMAEPE